MIIGFMGKGGSGKTSLSTAFTRFLHTQKQQRVLAIDADHNMDLLFNLAGEQTEFPYLGEQQARIKELLHIPKGSSYQAAIAQEVVQKHTLEHKNLLLQTCAREIVPDLWLMAAGPQTEEVQVGAACSHALAAPLKAYLPFLEVQIGEVVVIDSTAGMDMVGTGIANGMDLVCIATEPTIHATKTAKQIAAGLGEYGVPYCFVANKLQSTEQLVQTEAWLGSKVVVSFGFSTSLDEQQEALETLFTHAQKLVEQEGGNERRRARAVEQAKKGMEYQSH